MASKITVRHPTTGQTVPRTFAAYGVAEATPGVVGMLIDADNNVAAVGRTLREPPLWIIFFQGVKGGQYTLQVYPSPGDTPPQEVDGVNIPRFRPLELVIDDPPDNIEVCQTFVA